ncbi:MAG: hypothetical protein UU46_C0036G0007 [Candidatus Uhrbacteria bacterium GW2011_GWD1_41_16]|uniref:Uncharacterized protein n=1 Tax=Candidatus Uhrbacteria bacterium GW2011_GWC1_41_20 TaxID=1618983 RepID=A0A0G0V941_9BACT|nr:MAG: hypothetical protein UT52_C0027G0007 [Candidatus Uhrbacteria bacterium GW2011_GWE1_39_46]KKR63116.1 MAG: hypothetical protein UU04_C0026G0007 [Candidatus Uhrbacteria bacterium GW2011_GWC2_40_450]KKR94251.1 MAG: hypothetical protein UU46_C0036G0007 [Candidatus Uhrbacteria bacterium GW2011_GWD1_41_16]KKR97558.1 MAG: hypothetical protein UU50_C0028G0007 [Candidatus Uhrbacteria bacterium GW2011_GWC1_41_20]KKS06633.1 MAG: hypothetical protein UU62_C0036G0007 [Candidatus Uhrbacteria bacterium
MGDYLSSCEKGETELLSDFYLFHFEFSTFYFIPMDYILAATLGTLVGFLIAMPAIILEASRRVKNLPLLIDVHIWHGYRLKEGEVFAVGLLLHLIISACYGLVYVLFVEQGWLIVTHAPFSILSMALVAGLFWLFLNFVIFPLIGFGWIGLKEGKTVWFETLISLGVEGAFLWMLIQYYQPWYF